MHTSMAIPLLCGTRALCRTSFPSSSPAASSCSSLCCSAFSAATSLPSRAAKVFIVIIIVASVARVLFVIIIVVVVAWNVIRKVRVHVLPTSAAGPSFHPSPTAACTVKERRGKRRGSPRQRSEAGRAP